MKYQSSIRIVFCIVCMLFITGLTGCGISFCGFRPGGEKELTFTCQEEGLPPDTEDGEATDLLQGDSVEGANVDMSDTLPADAPAKEAEESGDSAVISDGKVNINTAGLEELMTLNGIGETRAKAIIAYREENGLFTKAEDIMQIPGIKEGIYSKIQDQIIVQ